MKALWMLSWTAVVLLGMDAQAQYPISVPQPKGTPAPAYKQLLLRARDDAKLIVHEWVPAKPAAGKPVVVFLHGIGMHGEPYASMAAGFTARQVVLVVPDLRGHGRSEGRRGELAEPHVLRADLGAVLGLVRERHPTALVILAGESMGGLLAADYAWRGERPLAGLALLAPAFAVHPSQIKLEAVGALLGGKTRLISDDKLKPSTREPGFIKARQKDPKALEEVSTAYLMAIARLQSDWPKAANELKLPLFTVIAGQDRVVDAAAIRRVCARVPSQKNVIHTLLDAHHTLCWDPDTPGLVETLVAWAGKVGK